MLVDPHALARARSERLLVYKVVDICLSERNDGINNVSLLTGSSIAVRGVFLWPSPGLRGLHSFAAFSCRNVRM